MDVGSWLRSLGLGQYEAAFRDNKIAADVLPRADGRRPQGQSASLSEIGKRLLKAIASWVREASCQLSCFPAEAEAVKVANSQPSAGRSR